VQLYLQRHGMGNGTMPDCVRAIAEALLTRGAQVPVLFHCVAALGPPTTKLHRTSRDFNPVPDCVRAVGECPLTFGSQLRGHHNLR